MLMAEMVEVKDHPILITLQDAVAGNGFLARITLFGRTLMRKEDGKWWMYGVQPSAIAASGKSIAEAFLNFKTSYQSILFDFAQDSADFSAFKKEVERFFNEADADNQDERMWHESLKTIRTQNCRVPEDFSDLPRQSAEAMPCNITVERVDAKSQTKFTPKDNVADGYSFAKAA
jgi:predicted RNase H-like HicB family nuclease